MDGIIGYTLICLVQRSNKSRMDGTQIIEGLRAAGVIPECFFKELGGLLIVLLDEHRAAFVIKCPGVITVCRHGDVCVPLSLLIVLLLQQRNSIKIKMTRGSYRDKNKSQFMLV